jgi:hypothetical protein
MIQMQEGRDILSMVQPGLDQATSDKAGRPCHRNSHHALAEFMEK